MQELRELVAKPGASQVEITLPAFPGRPLILHAARPTRFTAETPVLFSHHGRGRNGADYRDYFLPAAEAYGLLVIAPEFTDAAFPGQPWYNSGNLRDEQGRANDPSVSTYGIVEQLFAGLQAQGITVRRQYGLFGHSAGSQFVHRMVTFGYRSHVVVAVAANAGTYTMPDLDTAFPYGLGGTGLDAGALRRVLEFPLTIMAGTADNNPDDPFVPRDPGSLAQGATRYQRAYRYIEAGQSAARHLGTSCAWTIIDVPGVAHDGKRMAEAAVPVLAAALQAAMSA